MTHSPRPDTTQAERARPLIAPDFRRLFESAPECFLVLAPDPPRFTILAATDAYLKATLTRREEIVGRGMFEAFPDDPDDRQASAQRNSRASFERAIERRIPDTMAVQKHSISLPEAAGGGFEARYWSPLNTPVLDENGEVLYLLHRVEDVTAYLLQKRKQAEQQALAEQLQTRTGEMEVEIFRRAQEVQEVNRQLYAANGKLEELVRANREMARLREEAVRAEERLRASETAQAELERTNRALQQKSAEHMRAESELQRHRDHLELLVVERTAELELRNRQLEVESSQRKWVLELLSKSEQRYRAVVEDQTETICRLSRDGSYTFVNDVFCRLFGKTRAELIGSTWMPNAHQDDLPRVQELVATISPPNPVVTTENRVFDGAGGVRWMQFVNRGFFDDQGELAEIQAVGRDITERKQFEETVQSFAEEILDLYNRAPCGYHSLDAYGVIVRINETELKMLGYREDEILGQKRFVDLLEPECRETFLDNFSRFKEAGYVNGLEYALVRKDGSKLFVLLSATAIRDGQGTFVMSRGTLVDITERKRAEETLRRYAKRLIEMDEVLRRQLAAELHDELGQDLTVLGLNISFVGINLPAPSRERIGARIEDCSQLVKGMSRSLRQIMLNLRPSELDEYGLVSALTWHAGLFSRRTGVEVDFQADSDFPRLSEAAETALFRVAQEALLNVAKHTQAGRVVLRLEGCGNNLRFSIADDGAGFDPGAAAQPAAGNGWGLAIMRERAELIGGSFRVESAPGRGTRITVSLSEVPSCR